MWLLTVRYWMDRDWEGLGILCVGGQGGRILLEGEEKWNEELWEGSKLGVRQRLDCKIIKVIKTNKQQNKTKPAVSICICLSQLLIEQSLN